MTAEIAILNKTAIALAADSKVTVGAQGAEKTYEVNKLFTLSKYHPVGIMIYGNAEFMQFPWEVIIKSHRKALGSTSKATVQEYGQHFIESLTTDYKFSIEDQKYNLISIVSQKYHWLFGQVGPHLQELTFDPDEVEQALHIEIDKELKRLGGLKTLDFAKRITQQSFEKQYSKEVSAVIEGMFPADLDGRLKRKLRQLAYRHVVKDDFSPSHSGIVIGGFGGKEIFPSLVAYELDGVLFGRIKLRKTKDVDVSRQMTGGIYPFAQDDMVFRFMEGIDPGYQNFLIGVIPALFLQNCFEVIDKYVSGGRRKKQKIENEVSVALGKNLDKFFADTRDYRNRNFVNPIIEMVVRLPKEELANMAESLVNLTSLKRRISIERETVGGPIDVAVISKGDGFIWIKRKHYFEKELNPSFLENYYR